MSEIERIKKEPFRPKTMTGSDLKNMFKQDLKINFRTKVTNVHLKQAVNTAKNVQNKFIDEIAIK